MRESRDIVLLKRLERLQRDIWGEDDLVDPADLMLALVEAGGLVAAAYDGSEPVGFVFGFVTCDPRRQHSHRLGVHPEWQGRSLGRKLKMFQRDWCLSRGIELVTWTFDPIRRANAALNISALGATARRYVRDCYGEMPGINADLPSDRLYAEWQLNGPPSLQPQGAELTITIPLADASETAMAACLSMRHALEAAFAEGFVIRRFCRHSACYLLTRWDDTPFPADAKSAEIRRRLGLRQQPLQPGPISLTTRALQAELHCRSRRVASVRCGLRRSARRKTETSSY